MITFLIPTCVKNEHKRQRVREMLESMGYKYFFIEGERDAHSFGDSKTRLGGDCLYADVGDHYESLTLKVFAGINWIQNQTQGKSWIVKLDDDVVIEKPELFKLWLKQIQDSISHYFSCDKGICKPTPEFRRFHYGKCNDPFINKNPWHGKSCNEYAGGPCYMLSPVAVGIISSVWENPDKRKKLLDDWYEDVAVAAYLADHKIKPFHTNMRKAGIVSWP